MATLERMVQKIYHGKWEELEEMDKEWTTIESRHGYPSKTRYVYISGGHDTKLKWTPEIGQFFGDS